MRFLDLAVAGIIGLVVIGAGGALAPGLADAAAASTSEVIFLRDALLAAVEEEGLVRLQLYTFEQVCSWLSSISNSTITFSGAVGGVECSGGPPSGTPFAVLSLDVGSDRLVLRAWQ